MRAAGIPEALDRLVLSCLEKDPDRRPADAEALAAALATIYGPVPWTDEQARRAWENARPDAADDHRGLNSGG